MKIKSYTFTRMTICRGCGKSYPKGTKAIDIHFEGGGFGEYKYLCKDCVNKFRKETRSWM